MGAAPKAPSCRSLTNVTLLISMLIIIGAAKIVDVGLGGLLLSETALVGATGLSWMADLKVML